MVTGINWKEFSRAAEIQYSPNGGEDRGGSLPAH